MTDPRPNLLIFMTDQQHGGTVLDGHRLKAQTPTLDRFRAQATTFSRAYCHAPHCCPSRATFFTGRYPSQHGVWNNVNVPNALSRGLFEDVRPWSVDLQQAGYRLGFSGKWHVGQDHSPEAYGWDLVHGGSHVTPTPGDRAAQFHEARRDTLADFDRFRECLEPGPRADGEILRPGYPRYMHYGEQDNPFGDTTTTDAGLAKLHDMARQGQPWCQYIGTLGPHDPYFVPQRFLDLYDPDDLPPLPENFADPMLDKPALYRRTRDRFAQLGEDEHRQAIRHYLAFCSYEDWLFGRVLEALEATGQAEQTWVLYLSDHGDYAGEHGLWTKGLPAFDGAYHVPAIVRPPTASPHATAGQTIDALISLADFGPTFVQATGVTTAQPMAGSSLLPWFDGQTPDGWRDAMFFQTNGNEVYGIQRTVMTDDWKLVFNAFDADELYDRQADPGQLTNLYGQPGYETIQRELYARLWRLMLDHGDDYLNPYICTALADYGPGVVDGEP